MSPFFFSKRTKGTIAVSVTYLHVCSPRDKVSATTAAL